LFKFLSLFLIPFVFEVRKHLILKLLRNSFIFHKVKSRGNVIFIYFSFSIIALNQRRNITEDFSEEHNRDRHNNDHKASLLRIVSRNISISNWSHCCYCPVQRVYVLFNKTVIREAFNLNPAWFCIKWSNMPKKASRPVSKH